MSFAALFVSFYETSILETQNKASVWPYVGLGTGYSSEGFRISIKNDGVGPARLTQLTYGVDGKEAKDVLELSAQMAGEDPGYGYNIIETSTLTSSVLAAGESTNIYFIPWTPRTREVMNKFDIERLNASLCYCSIFGECWRVALNKPAQKDATCPKPKD